MVFGIIVVHTLFTGRALANINEVIEGRPWSKSGLFLIYSYPLR